MKSKISIKKMWNFASKDYQTRHKISPNYVHYGPWMPTENELKLIGKVRGMNILELGCGGGQCSIAFAKKGATATGIDISEEQLNFAKELAKKEGVNVKFYLASAENLKTIKSSSQDIVFSAYALQYVKNLNKVFKEVKSVLKKNGIFVFSFNHPFWDIFKFGTLKVNKSYFNFKGTQKDIFEWRVKDKKVKGHTILRKLDWIFNSLVYAGFSVERILEPGPVKKERAWDFSKLYPRKVLEKIPSTIIFKCRKR